MSGHHRSGGRLAGWTTLQFFARNFAVVAPLCPAVAAARFAQGGFGKLDWPAVIALEVLVELGRVALAVLAIGSGDIRRGIAAIRRFFTMDDAEREQRYAAAKTRLRQQWRSLGLDLLVFLSAAVAPNFLIAYLADSTCASDTLARVAPSAPRVSLVLLIKNLSVIPLTIAFQIHLAARLWLEPSERHEWLQRRT
ncbi:MAG TPA: hypothetical protein VK178_14355 [Opitutaceae bacterium]|nr:hypothetical protein [Opitutaceae bacterium]